MTPYNEKSDSTEGLKVVNRTSEILELIEKDGPIGVTTVSEELQIPTSTAHTYLVSLTNNDFLIKDGHEYRLALRFLRHGGYVRNQNKLYSAAKAQIDDLARKTGELANLGIEENGKRVLLYKADGDNAVYDDAPTGEFTHMHWSALGKVLLADHSPDELEDIIDRHGLPRGTEQTVCDKQELKKLLKTVRERGYALEDEHRVNGIQAVAMPIKLNNSTIGAVAISGPKSRLSPKRIENQLLDALNTAVNVIELQYSYY